LGAVQRGLPMPFAAVRNQRSLIYVGNLVDAIIACLEAPAAAGKTYLVSDGADVSTPDLVRKLAQAMSRPARLLPCPPALLKFAAGLLGKRDAALRLTGSLRIDSSRIREELGWRPRVGLNEGLALTAQWYDRGRQ
jgi:nucleoside-diphosphate-sugar epimerase